MSEHESWLELRAPHSLAQVGAWPETTVAVENEIGFLPGAWLPSKRGNSVMAGDLLIMLIAPGTFLVESDEPGIAARLASTITPEMGTVTDLTDARVAIRVSGSKAQRLLSSELALDLTLARFPIHGVAQGSIDEIGVIIRRVAEQEFDLYVYASFALALWERLNEAGNCE